MSTKDYVEKDYYKVLGVKKDASEADIKKAFHKLARENHPDAHPGDKQAEKRFKDVSEAYAVLSDPKERAEYDEARSMFGSGGFRFPRGNAGGGAQGGGFSGYEDLFARTRMGDDDQGFADLFGGLFGGGAASQRRGGQRGPRRGGDVEGEVTISFVQAVEGTTIALQLASDAACDACRGTGARSGSVPRVCPTCQGSGTQTSTQGGVFATTEPCHECGGRGLIIDDPCPECGGTGRARSTKTIQVRIPAGVTDGQRIRIKGKGSPGDNGGEAGDLYVIVHVTPHPDFGRDGDNITETVPITFPEASLGAEISVPTLTGGPVRIRVPAGTPSGRTLRVRGRGVHRSNGTSGDLLVTVEVAVPAHISDEAREALQAYARATADFRPRAEQS